jgi:hypothetical protein
MSKIKAIYVSHLYVPRIVRRQTDVSMVQTVTAAGAHNYFLVVQMAMIEHIPRVTGKYHSQ